ncbi:nickel pincer cofactor biosynthesis protein LarB [Xylanibacillus composti]|uniref:1-(5-phosphoribosyl)-5-amino-4-imidazole-carboxylate carboxylase n=1 Tax=Xylanibacillus composti TaxID=1572762 RepID=A0A8J4H052_9BACL|nr:nickel pincer cofactor biosynthesis protein LarB [Xylanibacillus composti]MDT9723548.1 nickel pincer cofactor biosynthesis protein LarB [Xylanibacillus composti]GIQ68414.1 1-(5-phosphoribosyl)-5-amino-4-imidazole-carboxylate carboxylase [Xylanibacillus composti]
MNIEQLLGDLQAGRISLEEAKAGLQDWRSAGSMDFAELDLDRERRTGFPEVIYGESKTAEQISAIFRRMMEHSDRVLATRVSEGKAESIRSDVPEAEYHPIARTLSWHRNKPQYAPDEDYVAVVCAGTSDLPVAEEAAVTAEMLGCRVERIFDVGVAGIHRLFRRLELIRGAQAVVAVAGMEGALASVLAGLVERPVVAVPTSVGYGANFQGMAALLAMINACAPGIAVVNIDNGFGAGYYAALIQQNRKG